MKKLYRGVIINPLSSDKLEFFKDGALIVNDEGKIEFCGQYEEYKNLFEGEDVQVDDSEGRVIIPAFCDTHIHLPQYDVRGTFSGTELLPWLKKYIWPEESNFKDPEHARDVAKRFFKDLIRNGTLTAVTYGTIHEQAVRIMFEECGIRAIIGKVMMDQNSPDYLSETTKESLETTENLCRDYAHKGDTYFAVTPRFAPTCTMEQMTEGAKLAKKYDTFIQTHLNENKDEIKWVAELFPDCKNYSEVYNKAGLLGPKTIMAHVIHSTDEELELLKSTETKIAHCPTSNVALCSGRMPIEQIQEKGLKFALATDVGAGPDVSMLDVIRCYLDVHKDIPNITPESGLYYATLAGAEILGFDKETGNLDKKKYADFLILDAKPEEDETVSDIIRRIVNAGDYDNAVQKTFFKGKQVYSK